MRLWTIHPKYLDKIGFIALWRESLLAQKVLDGKTKGYKNHPQLIRFKEFHDPLYAIGSFLTQIIQETERRGYLFDKSKILKPNLSEQIIETSAGQLEYEFIHLKNKIRKRDIDYFCRIESLNNIIPNPIFKISPGKIESWEKYQALKI